MTTPHAFAISPKNSVEGPGNGLGEIELVYVFCLTEIETVVQLLEDDEPGALLGERLAFGSEPLLVVFYVCGVMLLDDSYC